jgi:predicted ABC-type ATPase
MISPPDSPALRHIYIIAGPNGSGKTTFARRFIPASASITQFVDADLIASGLSPFAPEREAVQAGKLMLRQIAKLVGRGESFSFETTLAGRSHARMIPQWQVNGTKQVAVSFKKYALDMIDRKARELGMTRSGFLGVAAAAYDTRERRL